MGRADSNDYEAVTDGTLIIPASSNSTFNTGGTFKITTTADDTQEPNDIFLVALTLPANANAVLPEDPDNPPARLTEITARGTIVDDDALPTLTIADPTNPVTESAGSVDFVVTARDPGSLTFRYQASEVDGANFLNENKTPTSQEAIMETTLIFGQVGGTGDNVATLNVDIHNDSVGENTGRILVTLLGPASGQTPTYQVNTDGTENAYATIWDDDAPVVSIGNATNVTESSTRRT